MEQIELKELGVVRDFPDVVAWVMTGSRLHYVPLTAVILFPVTIFLTYTIAVALGHAEAGFPYISDTGTMPPESCIFGQLMSISVALLGLTFYIRFQQIRDFCNHFPHVPKVRKLNNVSFPLGLVATFGMSMVANFQETSVLAGHYTGAVMAFGCGTAYFWFQAIVSYELAPHLNSIRKAHYRIALAIICTVCFIIACGCGLLARKYYHGHDPLKWYPSDGGWGLHVTSTGAEWVMALCFDIFVASFVSEFKRLLARPPEFLLDVEHLGIGRSLSFDPVINA